MSGPRVGLLEGVRGLAVTLVRSFKTRVELAQVELEQERDRFLVQFGLLMAAVLFASLGLFLAVLGLMLALAPEWRAILAGAAAVVFLLVAGTGFWTLLRSRQKHEAMFSGLLGVMQGDIDVLCSPAVLGDAPVRSAPAAVMGSAGARP